MVTLFILSPDAQGQVDPTLEKNLFVALPRCGNAEQADVVAVPITWMPGFVFQEPSLMGKPWVLFDFMEGGFPNPEYQKFEAWVEANPPIMRFERELKLTDASPTRRPIEFPAYVEIPETETREQYEARPYTVFYSWGMSNHRRPLLHGDIFRHGMAFDGLNVLCHFDQLGGGPAPPLNPAQQTWVSIYTPYWIRRDISEFLALQKLSKVSVSMPGNGVKCFRSTEAPVGTLLAQPMDDLAWSFPWDETNSLRLDTTDRNEYGALREALDQDLYPLYVASQENIRKYSSQAYCDGYILPAIESCL